MRQKLVLTTVFRECQTLPEMITIFLATLELIKVHEVEVEQEKILVTLFYEVLAKLSNLVEGI